MTDVGENSRIITVIGDLKIINIQTDGNAATGFLIDLDSDATDGRSAACKEILNTLIQDDQGRDETCTWDPATGVITLGSLNATGIHNITIFCR